MPFLKISGYERGTLWL